VKFIAIIAALLVSSVAVGSAQKMVLTPDDVLLAVTEGLRNKNKEHGLDLQDVGSLFANAMASGNSKNSSGSGTGFSVLVYTPTTWVTQQAARAAKEYRSFAPTDVTGEMVAPVLRVVVEPDTPTSVTAKGVVGTSSVQHVVLRDESKKIAVQPKSKEETTREVSNAMGGKKVYTGLNAIFDLDDVMKVRGPNHDAEFFITVIGTTGEEKDFKVKKKHFERLK
jgi:hypothetical protein